MLNSRAEPIEENGEENNSIDVKSVPTESFEVYDSESQRTVADDFLAVAETCVKEMNLCLRNNERLFIGLEEGIQNEIKRIAKIMRESMKYMHEEASKLFQSKLEEFMQVSKRVEMLFEDMKERRRQMEQKGNMREMESSNQTFLEESNQEKEGAESEVEEIISYLNKKRQGDERMLMEFRESVHSRTHNSLKSLRKSLELSSMTNSSLMSEKCEELEIALQHLSKFDAK